MGKDFRLWFLLPHPTHSGFWLGHTFFRLNLAGEILQVTTEPHILVVTSHSALFGRFPAVRWYQLLGLPRHTLPPLSTNLLWHVGFEISEYFLVLLRFLFLELSQPSRSCQSLLLTNCFVICDCGWYWLCWMLICYYCCCCSWFLMMSCWIHRF